ncbi:dihydroxyacetone kinase phosphoryl donor subunit DhaM [Actinotalea sp.]|uniref:dihydroxyacetone kinase phosphoryl donor subunit DhaM n=1 Tax=Actinotalea sp. TaxID=1872145 RepID=UPI003564071B
MSPRVALVLVSHSRDVAVGTAAIAEQMAPEVGLFPAGGVPEGIGTSVDLVLSAVEEGLAAVSGEGSGVVVLTDLGSALLTTDLVLEMIDEDEAARVRVPSAPFVEGAVTAAVKAQQGGSVEEVAAAAAEALSAAPAAVPAESPPQAEAPVGDEVVATVTVRNPMGLHARPAALLARTVADLGVPLTIDGSDGASVLGLMALSATGGRELTVRATGPGAQAAVETVVAMVEEGFGEV